MSVAEPRRQAEDDAARALIEYGAVDLADMPVDATRIARFFDADVYFADLDSEGLDGFMLIDGDHAEITVNESAARNRRRFTVAHELGHLRHARSNRRARRRKLGYVDDSETVREYHRDEASRDGGSDEEKYANAFAAALLMPERLVRQLHRSGESVAGMARFFRVSEQAMLYRVTRLGLR
ncbi:MAG: ImmA/IrrE family metallo-endopeptidase [Actinomycetia bacterium]|nr:ImmA/IrrE family metallo-endopeptidase [Actinomycetes bacterium]